MGKDDDLRTLLEILRALVQEHFWGQIIIKFKDGEPVLIQQEKLIKLK